MPAANLILHFGNDSLLSEARIRILEDAGYKVVSATTKASALRLLRTRCIGLVIMCHSVPPGEVESTAKEIRKLKARVPLILVHLGGLVRALQSVADGFVDGLRGPDHLLAQVATLIGGAATLAAD